MCGVCTRKYLWLEQHNRGWNPLHRNQMQTWLSTEISISPPHLRWLLWVFGTVLSLLNKSIRGKHSSKDSNFNWKTIALFPATTRHHPAWIDYVWPEQVSSTQGNCYTLPAESTWEHTFAATRKMPTMRETGPQVRHTHHSRASEFVFIKNKFPGGRACALQALSRKSFSTYPARADFLKSCLSATWLLSDCLLRNPFLLGHAKVPTCHAVCVSWTHIHTELWQLQSCFSDLSLKISCPLCASQCSRAGAKTKCEWLHSRQ